ncbi:MAG: ComEC/Rec2 family competence protein [Armatimonadota bacterium]
MTLRFAWLTLALSLWAFSPARGQQADHVELAFLNVGQGDAIVIRSPEGKVAIIDAGSGLLGRRLRRMGVDTIQLAIATHPHSDHIGGMAELMLNFTMLNYMDNGVPHTTSTYSHLMYTLRRDPKITYLEATERTIRLGSVALHIIPPPPSSLPPGERVAGDDGLNNQSIGVVVEFGEFRALLTGDSEVEELNYFLTRGVPQVTVLKAAHHGSRDAVTPAWLSATKPEVVVISVGRNNEYGHPHPWALRYYEATAKEIFRTDLHGDVTILGNRDGTYEVITGRREGGGGRS